MITNVKSIDPVNTDFDLLGTGLIYASSQKENAKTYTTDIAIANATGFTKKYVDEKIRTHEKRLLQFGVLPNETAKPNSKSMGRPLKIYKLNRKQAIALCNTFDDSEFVLDFKFQLADAFINAIDILSNRKITHEQYKPRVIELGQAIITLVGLGFDYHEVKNALSIKVIKLPVIIKGE